MAILTSLEASIKSKLQEINNFSYISDTFTITPDWYPSATFELRSFDGEFLDTCSNRRNFTFNIDILDKVTEGRTREDAKRTIYNCLDQIIEKFDGQQDLWNNQIVIWQVTNWEMGTFLEGEWQVLALTVNLTLTINNSII